MLGQVTSDLMARIDEAAYVMIDPSRGSIYCSDSPTDGAAMFDLIDGATRYVVFEPDPGQTGKSLTWAVDAQASWLRTAVTDKLTVAEKPKRSLFSLINTAFDAMQGLPVYCYVDQSQGKVFFYEHQSDTPSAGLRNYEPVSPNAVGMELSYVVNPVSGEPFPLVGPPPPDTLLTGMLGCWHLDASDVASVDGPFQGTWALEVRDVGEQYAYLAHSAALEFGDTDFTIAVLVKLTNNGSPYQWLAMKRSLNGNGEWGLHSNQNGSARFWRYNAGWDWIDTAAGSLPQNSWRWIIGWRDAATDTIGVHIPGTSAATKGNVTAPVIGAHQLQFGADIGSVSGDPYIAQAAIWNRVLTANERDTFSVSGVLRNLLTIT
jgi:hypothetical protein